MGTTLTTTTIITDFEIWSTLLNSINEYTDTYTDAKETKRHQRVYKAEDLVVLVQIQIDIFMFSVSFVIVMFYCFFKERGGFYGRRRVGNDFVLTRVRVGLCVCYIFVHRRNIETRPRKKTQKIFCFCRYRSGRTRAENGLFG
jgi:hypothetical protein